MAATQQQNAQLAQQGLMPLAQGLTVLDSGKTSSGSDGGKSKTDEFDLFDDNDPILKTGVDGFFTQTKQAQGELARLSILKKKLNIQYNAKLYYKYGGDSAAFYQFEGQNMMKDLDDFASNYEDVMANVQWVNDNKKRLDEGDWETTGWNELLKDDNGQNMTIETMFSKGEIDGFKKSGIWDNIISYGTSSDEDGNLIYLPLTKRALAGVMEFMPIGVGMIEYTRPDTDYYDDFLHEQIDRAAQDLAPGGNNLQSKIYNLNLEQRSAAISDAFTNGLQDNKFKKTFNVKYVDWMEGQKNYFNSLPASQLNVIKERIRTGQEQPVDQIYKYLNNIGSEEEAITDADMKNIFLTQERNNKMQQYKIQKLVQNDHNKDASGRRLDPATTNSMQQIYLGDTSLLNTRTSSATVAIEGGSLTSATGMSQFDFDAASQQVWGEWNSNGAYSNLVKNDHIFNLIMTDPAVSLSSMQQNANKLPPAYVLSKPGAGEAILKAAKEMNASFWSPGEGSTVYDANRHVSAEDMTVEELSNVKGLVIDGRAVTLGEFVVNRADLPKDLKDQYTMKDFLGRTYLAAESKGEFAGGETVLEQKQQAALEKIEGKHRKDVNITYATSNGGTRYFPNHKQYVGPSARPVKIIDNNLNVRQLDVNGVILYSDETILDAPYKTGETNRDGKPAIGRRRAAKGWVYLTKDEWEEGRQQKPNGEIEEFEDIYEDFEFDAKKTLLDNLTDAGPAVIRYVEEMQRSTADSPKMSDEQILERLRSLHGAYPVVTIESQDAWSVAYTGQPTYNQMIGADEKPGFVGNPDYSTGAENTLSGHGGTD